MENSRTMASFSIESDVPGSKSIKQAVYASEMASVLWEFNVNVARKWLRKSEELTPEQLETAEKIFKDFRDLCVDFGLPDLDELAG